MLNKIATSLAKKLISNKTISEEMLDIYVYGFELLISFLFSTTIVIACGMILNRMSQTIAFLCVFIFLRSFTGGYHAKTYLFCSVVTLLTYGIVLLASSLMEVTIIYYVLILIVGIILLIIFAPIKHPNKEIVPKQRIKYKLISLILFFLFSTVGILLIKISNDTSSAIMFTLIADLVLLFIKNRKEIKK